jgi:23S rRNA pseudouridine2605 synthase
MSYNLTMTDPYPKLQTFLAHAGVASRRKSEELIKEGKVTINGQVAQIGERVKPEDTVLLEGKEISGSEEKVTYLIYKPVGVVSTTSDELGRKNVVDFLKKELGAAGKKLPRLYPVGRLDIDSEGLMLLTNDGKLTQEMTHPSFETPKTYRVKVEGEPTERAISHLERGVKLREGYTSPAVVEIVELHSDHSVLEITIHEGRNHQVKRMLQRVGYEVVRLIRIKMGEYSLDDLEGKKFKKV